MSNSTAPYRDFNEHISFIDKQLKYNILLIEKADVVFVCGECNTGLTAISLKVGEIKCASKTKLNKKPTSLIIANKEYNTPDLVDVMHKFGLPNNRPTMRFFTESRYSDTVHVMKNRQSVGVMDGLTKVDQENILRQMVKNSLSGAIVIHRFPTPRFPMPWSLEFSKIPQQNFLYALKATADSFGLKLLFIETLKDPKSGLIDLIFS